MASNDDHTAGDHNALLSNSSGLLLSFCERFERLSEEIGALSDDRKEVMAEAKSAGFDTKILRTAIRRRAMDVGDRADADALLHTYEEGLAEATKRAREKSIAEGGDPE